MRKLAAQESLDDDHRATAFGAGLGLVSCVGTNVLILTGFQIGVYFNLRQAPDLCDPVAADTIGEETSVADAVEAGGQDMDQETADELIRGQAQNVHPVSLFDPVAFPAEGHCARISAAVRQFSMADITFNSGRFRCPA